MLISNARYLFINNKTKNEQVIYKWWYELYDIYAIQGLESKLN
nr:hypothetical protein [Mycoplasmopsis bovis]